MLVSEEDLAITVLVYENEAGNTNSRVTSMIWNNQGHASLLIDQNSPELWALIDNWIKNTET